MKRFLKELKRSHYCNELSAKNDGEEVVLMGWVDGRRDHGGLIFLDLRDRSGLVQVVVNPKEESLRIGKEIRNEFVLAIQGKVRVRPEGMVNKNLASGEIEVETSRLEILSKAETLPFQPDDQKVSDLLRLKYRYLDLRSPRIQSYLKTRHDFMQVTRKSLSEAGFYEIETPIMYKSTPEGARDYIVPSRVHPGKFYALPQSPQTLKQLLMVSGFDKYFQIARCFRDEDLRADRQPEFTQIDVEMSFVDQDDVMAMATQVTRDIWKAIKSEDIGEIPRMTYQEAMDRFGSDKPDLRIPWEFVDLTDELGKTDFRVFSDVASRGGAIKGLFVPGTGSYSRGQMDKLTQVAKEGGAKGLVYIKVDDKGAVSSPVSKFFKDDELKAIYKKSGGVDEGGTCFIVADDFEVTCASLSAIRLKLANELGAIDKSKDRFLFVTDFPLLQYSPEEKRWVACHHPFTQPEDEHIEILREGREKEFSKVKAKAYDLVCNGYEIAGGSVRIHQQDVQDAMFKALGFSEEEKQAKFGFFVEALTYGTPPHGGIAFGLDRMVMILCGTSSIREVIAFPKTTKAGDLMADAPSEVAREQLLELGVRIASSQQTT